MRILKYKKMSNGKYKLYLDNGTDLLLYEDVILKYNLLLTKNIDNNIEEINKYNLECDCYYVALKSLNSRFKSVKELRDFLLKKEYPQDFVDKSIDKLIRQGYLNDRSFSKSFINNQIITTNKGPNKIRSELIKRGISKEIIEEEVLVFSVELQKEKIDKTINKMIKLNKTRGGIVLKKKIYNDLIQLGYDNFLINDCLNHFDFSNTSDIATKEYNKLYKKLSKKYSGKELDYKIKEKLFQKGLYYED